MTKSTNINWKLLVFYLIVSRKFRLLVKDAILYALNNANEKRGLYCNSVFVLETDPKFKKCLNYEN